MKHLITLSILLLFNLHLASQDLKKLLQENRWQTNEDIAAKHTKPFTIYLNNDSTPDFKLRFLLSGELEYIKVTKTKEYDLEGNEIPPGTYTISSYKYEIKNNFLKVHQKITHNLSNEARTKAYYYKISAQPAQKTIELSPVAEKEYK